MNKANSVNKGSGLSSLVQFDKEHREAGIRPFIYFKPHWVSTCPALVQKAEELAAFCKVTRTSERIRQRDFKNAFISILSGLEVEELYADRCQVRINTDKTIYVGCSQRDTTHTTDVHAALSWLISNNYLEEVDGQKVFGFTGKHLPKAYRLSRKWRSLVSATPFSTSSELTIHPLTPTVEIRSGAKRGRYRRSIKLDGFEAELQSTCSLIAAHKQLMCRHEITLNGVPFNSETTALRRLFTNDLTSGGRFYHYLQNIRAKDRLKIKINGKSVVEVDFSSMHPTLLFTLAGCPKPKDPYQISGFFRSDVKTAFAILLNSDRRRSNLQVVRSIRKHTKLPLSRAAELLKKVRQQFHEVDRYFECGYGLKLQHMDSMIMAKVMDYFVHTLKAPILPIHDSAIVQVNYLDHLCYALWASYDEVMLDARTGESGNREGECREERLAGMNSCGIKITSSLAANEEEWMAETLQAL